jgi:putative phosphoesterase
MMKIGLISDTHGFLDSSYRTYFNSCDEIWHLGDVGTKEILEELERFKPTRAVYGNIDGQDVRVRSKEFLSFNLANERFLLIHIAGKAGSYTPQVRKLIKEHQPSVLICGHSHILKVVQDKKNDLLYMNPGAAGRQGFHKMRTLLRFEVTDNGLENLEVIELGSRSAIR